MGSGDEAPQTFHAHQGTTTVGGKHFGVDGGVFLLELANPLPCPLVFDPTDRQRQLTIFVLLTHDEELTDLAGLEHVAQTLDPVDRHLLQRHEGSRLGADVDHGALRFQGEDRAVDDVARLEVVVVLAEESRELIQGESGVVQAAAGGAAAWIIRGGDVFRNAQILTLKRLFGGGGFCRGFCGVRVLNLILDLIFCRSRRHGGLAVYLRWVVRENRVERPPTFHGELLTLQTRPTALLAQRWHARVQRTDSVHWFSGTIQRTVARWFCS